MNPLQGVLDALPDGVLVVDREGIIEQANRNIEDILGYAPPELEGMVVEDLLLAEDRKNHVQFRQEYMENPEPRPMGRELDLYALRKDGRNIPVEISLGPIEQDGALYVVATIADITNRKQRERELQRQNERLDEFASIVSHDLRNPLNVAEGRLTLAMEECDSDHLDAAACAHNRMKTLIEDLLTLAREGEPVQDVETVNLATTVERCWQNVDTQEATLISETDRTIRANQDRFQQLLENLIRNAIEHSGTDVAVTIGGLDDGFYVEDDGPGISADQRDQVFQRGYSTSPDGTGFGLAIVEEIAEAHGWEIRVTESNPRGARFEITGVEFVAE